MPGTTATTATPTTSPSTPSTTVTASVVLDARSLLEALASDELTGRDNQTLGSSAAQELIIGQISQFARPAFLDGYLQPFAYGTNIVGLIPGSDLADQFIIIGAHYDHLGSNCRTAEVADLICNGATDNASGSSVVISIARAIAAEGTPRRSVIVALWDAEEDGLLGSAAYVAAPAVPIAQTVAYFNFDIQGAVTLPSLANVTFAIGAETGGAELADASAAALVDSALRPIQLRQFLFQGRSDHSNFANAGVPAMLFTDAAGSCYHTAQDEADIVDFAKLDAQVAAGISLVRELASTDTPPRFDATAPNISFEDVVALLTVAELSEADVALLSPGAAAQVTQFANDLRAIVDAGEASFDEDATATVLTGVDNFVEALTQSDCQNFVQ